MLVSHGSRDPRPGQAMERLAQVVLAQIQRQQVTAEVQSPAVRAALTHSLKQAQAKPDLISQGAEETHRRSKQSDVRKRAVVPRGSLVGTACLECSPIPLHQQVVGFSRRAAAAGVKTIRIIPLFLLQGVHVMEDIPGEIELAQNALPDLALELCLHLGSHPRMKSVLKSNYQMAGPGSLLLLAHGSRRPGGNESIHALAEALGGVAAFWAVSPSLEHQIIHLTQNGIQQLTILPYFLFAGSITDAITRTAEALAERFPQVAFHLLPPLGPTENLAGLVTDLALNRVKLKTQKSNLIHQRTAFRYPLPSSMVS